MCRFFLLFIYVLIFWICMVFYFFVGLISNNLIFRIMDVDFGKVFVVFKIFILVWLVEYREVFIGIVN